ncbi:hypothetical protein [Exiguobacterium sp. MH3]|uniref:hypothetical protein n=1 Tax=Exiguobacterium sp. MH3 TaxID=1399115 RepID=UPI0003C3C10A|nr:hypothetical protein [Exiguobacterium sp. MH3]AHA31528.1 hypothetical protein U719_14350 [Exiguobacterium sp. MH3]
MTKTMIGILVLLCGGVAGALFRQLKGTSSSPKRKTTTQTKQTIDELAESYSKKVDQLILKEVNQTGHQFVSGIFTLKANQEERIELVADLYFQDASENWLHQKSQDFMPMNTLSEAAQAEFLTQNEFQFDVETPTELLSEKEDEVVS